MPVRSSQWWTTSDASTVLPASIEWNFSSAPVALIVTTALGAPSVLPAGSRRSEIS